MTHTTKPNDEILIPALRARLGDWWYYLCSMSFHAIAERVSRVKDIHEKQSLKTWIQREIVEQRTQQIANYIFNQPQRFFNALVLGIYGGEPEWVPVTIDSDRMLHGYDLGGVETAAFGFIKLSGSEEIFPVDGQHRVEGIKRALSQDEDGFLRVEEQAVIFVAHKATAEGRERTRRLFSTLNKYARPVSKAELIALSEDDTFAIVTRKLIDEYAGLNINTVSFSKTANISASDTTSLTSLITLYECCRAVGVAKYDRRRSRLVNGPTNPELIAEVYERNVEFWNAIKTFIPAVNEVLGSGQEERVPQQYRSDGGGFLVFRPFGLEVFAKASRMLVDRGFTFKSAVEVLSSVPMRIEQEPWRNVCWDPAKNRMLLNNKNLSINILLVLSGQEPNQAGLDVPEEYKRVTGSSGDIFPRS